MTRITRIALVAALAVLAATIGTAAAQSSTDVTVDVTENGDADWTVTTIIPIDSDAERQAMQRLNENATERDALADRVAGSFQSFAERASGEVDREMAIQDVAVSAEPGQDSASVSVAFTWTNFAATTDGDLTIDDLFDGGLSLADGETMTVSGPDGYALADDVAAGEGSIEGNAVTWTGPVDVGQDVRLSWSGGDDGGDEGMPGFAAIAAIAALGVATAFHRR